MSEAQSEWQRRMLLKSAAALAVGQVALHNPGIAVGSSGDDEPAKPGDFDFLAGKWKIKNRRLKVLGTDQWEEFDGESTCWTILGGIGSIEELRIPVGSYLGMGLRLLDVEKKVWNDFWISAKNGVLTTPGQSGIFKNGVGTFIADDMDGDKPIKVKGVWDRITSNSCRWFQSISTDGGVTWQDQWFMDWTKDNR